MPCGFCGAVRGVLPNQVAAYLLRLHQRKLAARKAPAVSIKYTTTPPDGGARVSPGQNSAPSAAGGNGAEAE